MSPPFGATAYAIRQRGTHLESSCPFFAIRRRSGDLVRRDGRGWSKRDGARNSPPDLDPSPPKPPPPFRFLRQRSTLLWQCLATPGILRPPILFCFSLSIAVQLLLLRKPPLISTFDSLPFETLLRILEHAGEPDIDDIDEPEADLTTLAAAVFVARSWKELTVAFMWRRLEITRLLGTGKRIAKA